MHAPRPARQRSLGVTATGLCGFAVVAVALGLIAGAAAWSWGAEGTTNAMTPADQPHPDSRTPRVPGMVYIPAGEFISGTTDDEKQELSSNYDVHPSWFQGEPPQSLKTTGAFYVDRYEVTNAQFKAYLDATGSKMRPLIWPGDWPDGFGSLPLCGVSYDMALAYAEWAGKRLPTSLEREKAARGIDGRRYPWGDEWDPEACDHANPGEVPDFPKPVGYFAKDKSPFGVFGCAGGVVEWTSDAEPWATGNVPNLSRTMGGSFIFTEPYDFRCATCAFTQMWNNRLAFQGFRCALDADRAAQWVAEHPDPVLATPGSKPVGKGWRPNPPSEGPIQLSSNGQGTFVSITVPAMGHASFSFQVPEAVFSDRGIVFSRPRHSGDSYVGRIGHKMRGKGWRVSPDRTEAVLDYPDVGEAGITGALRVGADYVDYDLTVINNGERPLGSVVASSCLAVGGEPLFRDPEQRRTSIVTDKGWTPLSKVDRNGGVRNLYRKYRIAGSEYDRARPTPGMYEAVTKGQSDLLAITSIDGKWVIAVAAEEGVMLMSNAEYSCIHSEPHFGSIEPGESAARRGRLYFMRGTLKDLEQRAAALDWR